MKLKVKDVKVHMVAKEQAGSVNGKACLGVVRVITEDGLEGHAFMGTRATDTTRSMVPIVENIKPFLVGKNALDRELLWHQMRGMAAKWDVSDPTVMAVDVALWDLAGKAGNLPLYQMLGAYRHKALAYCTAPFLPEIEATVEDALACKEQRLGGYKVHHALPDLDRVITVCTKVREAVGDEMALMLDCGGAYTFQEALYVGRALDELGYEWYEDPMPPNALESLAELSGRLDIPIAISDAREFRLAEAPAAITQHAARMLIGDPKKDGVTGLKKLATICEAHQLTMQFHYGGNSVLNIAGLHVALSIGNSNLYPLLLPLKDHQFGLVEELAIDPDGYLHAPEKPGLGVELDWALIDHFTEAVI